MKHQLAHRWFLKIMDKDRQAWRQRPRLYRSSPVAIRAWHHVGIGRYNHVSYLHLLMKYAQTKATQQSLFDPPPPPAKPTEPPPPVDSTEERDRLSYAGLEAYLAGVR